MLRCVRAVGKLRLLDMRVASALWLLAVVFDGLGEVVLFVGVVARLRGNLKLVSASFVVGRTSFNLD